MRVKTMQLINFKRFDNLKIELGENPAKLVALIGPNGSGKSSVFDAFEQILQQYVGANRPQQPWYYSKRWHDRENPVLDYNLHQSIRLKTDDGREFPGTQFDPKNFYVRSAYRFTPQLRVDAIRQLQAAVAEADRPGSSAGLDQRLQRNYERLLGRLINTFFRGDKTGTETRAELIGSINARLGRVLDIRISDLGDVSAGKGQLFFEKGASVNFPFENLSAGEKEVVDLILDMEVKVHEFDDTVFCIDEPEIHLNTAIQRKLLLELADMVGANNQLWIATHSVGFLRALQEDLQGDSQVLDFSAGNYFDQSATIEPMRRTRANWQRVFSTALEDITGLVAPREIVYCEGRQDPAANGAEQGLDASVYNQIFESERPEALFVSAGGGGAHIRNASLALLVMTKALPAVDFILLKDRDEKTDEELQEFLGSNPSHRILRRREIENYLFDQEVIEAACRSSGRDFDAATYGDVVQSINNQDLKVGQIAQSLMALCGANGRVADFKKGLAKHITPDTRVFKELRRDIFRE